MQHTILAGSPLPNNTTLGYGLAEGGYTAFAKAPLVEGVLNYQVYASYKPLRYRFVSWVHPYFAEHFRHWVKEAEIVRQDIPLRGRTIQELEKLARKHIQGAIAEVIPVGSFGWKAQTRYVVSQIKLGGLQSIESAFGKARWTAVTKRIGFGFDFAVGGYVQWQTDRDNPYLTGGQTYGRVIVSGLGSGGFGLLGGTALGLVGAAICAPCGVVAAIGGGLLGGLSWGQFQPYVFSEIIPFLEPERRLNERGN